MLNFQHQVLTHCNGVVNSLLFLDHNCPLLLSCRCSMSVQTSYLHKFLIFSSVRMFDCKEKLSVDKSNLFSVSSIKSIYVHWIAFTKILVYQDIRYISCHPTCHGLTYLSFSSLGIHNGEWISVCLCTVD